MILVLSTKPPPVLFHAGFPFLSPELVRPSVAFDDFFHLSALYQLSWSGWVHCYNIDVRNSVTNSAWLSFIIEEFIERPNAAWYDRECLHLVDHVA